MALNVDSRTNATHTEIKQRESVHIPLRPLIFLNYLIVISLIVYGASTINLERAREVLQTQKEFFTSTILEKNPDIREIPVDAQLIDTRPVELESGFLPKIDGESVTWIPFSVGQNVTLSFDDGSTALVQVTKIHGKQTLWEDNDRKHYIYSQPLTFDARIIDHQLLSDPNLIEDPENQRLLIDFSVESIILQN
jgi:hypothetical protein